MQTASQSLLPRPTAISGGIRLHAARCKAARSTGSYTSPCISAEAKHLAPSISSRHCKDVLNLSRRAVSGPTLEAAQQEEAHRAATAGGSSGQAHSF